jgi:large subunit ribosomal protein L7Ae
MYNDGPRVSWGGGIMGPKSQAIQRKREKALAKDARV